jgi:hypothetical protein
MSFQWIIDNAVDVQVNKRDIVAQTTSRDQTVRSVSRGNNIWRFTVTPSPGTYWKDARPYIEAINALNQFTSATINFNRPETNYIFGYQGNSSNITNWVATAVKGATSITLTTSSGTQKLKVGDLIQLGSTGKVYTVTADVNTGNIVQLNRPVLDANGSYSLVIGRACNFKIKCTQLPDYKISPLGIVEWTGPFIFTEDIL